MPVLVSPPDSPYMDIVKRLAEILEDDDELRDYFGWEDPAPGVTPGSEDDDPLRRRIFFDDSGAVDKSVSPKLVLTEFAQLDDFTILGDGGDVDSDIAAHIAVVVYVAVDRQSDSEKEKILVGNLHNAVRQKIRQHPVEENGMWLDLNFVGVSAAFDQSDGFRRAGGILSIVAQKRIT